MSLLKRNFSTVPKLVELYKETASVSKIIYTPIALFVFALVLVIYFKLPVLLVFLLISFEILSSIVIGILRMVKIRRLFSINVDEDSKAYKEVMVESEKWSLVLSIVTLFVSFVTFVIVFLIFKTQIFDLINTLGLRIASLFLLVPIYRFVELVIRYVRYLTMRGVKTNLSSEEMVFEYLIIQKKFIAFENVPAFLFIMYLFLVLSVPFEMFIVFGFIAVIFLVAPIIEIKRMRKFSSEESVKVVSRSFDDEYVVASLFGVLSPSSMQTVTFMGVGKNNYPENGIVVTNHRVLMVQIPTFGGGKVLDEVNFSSASFLLDGESIVRDGEELLSKNSVGVFNDIAVKEFLREDILDISFNQTLIKFKIKGVGTLEYICMSKDRVEKFRDIVLKNI